MGFMSTSGQFDHFTGHVVYDLHDLENAKVDASIKSESVDTHLAPRDFHLKQKDFFDIAAFPTITFKSEKITKGQGGMFDMVGILSMHGFEKEVTLHVQPLEIRNPDNYGQTIHTTAFGVLDRKDFKIANGMTGKSLGNKVEITLDIELTQSSLTNTPASKQDESVSKEN
jgi:polyisoprenoid-binding protein YceI